MEATDIFTNTISAHLQSVAASDPLFAETLKKANKNIKDCITYILTTVKSSGRNGFADEEIFGMAIHYYDEDDIKIGTSINAKVVVNHRIDTPIKTSLPEPKQSSKKAVKERPGIHQESLFG